MEFFFLLFFFCSNFITINLNYYYSELVGISWAHKGKPVKLSLEWIIVNHTKK